MTGRLLQTVLRQAEALAADAGPDAAPDAELLARFAGVRDEAAFAALVRRHGPMVWAACRHLLPNPADAEDAFQATFLALVRSADKVRAGAAVGGWLHGVAARRRRREEKAAGPEADRPVPETVWDELLAAVHEEVQRLPEALRTAFVLCDLEGVRQPDAAARLGWKPGTLSGRLTKARQRLVARLADRGIASGVAAGALAVGAASAGGAVPAVLAGKVVGLATAATGAVPPAIWELAREVTPMMVNRTKLLAAAVLVAGGLSIGVGAAVLPTADAQTPSPPGAPAAGTPAGPPTGPVTGGGRPGAPSGGGQEPALPTGGIAGLSDDSGGAGGAGMPGMGGPGGMMGKMGGSSGGTARTRWEYKFAGKPKSALEFAKLLREYGDQGWEYAGLADFDRAEQLKAAKADPTRFGYMTGDLSAVVVFKRPVQSGPRDGMMGGRGGGRMPPGDVAPAGGGRAGRGGPGAGMAGGLVDPGMRIPPGMGSAGRAGMPGMPGIPGGFQVIAVKHARATELANTLNRLFPNAQVVVADRINSLIVKADADTLKEMQDLLQKLDVPAPNAPQPGGGSDPFDPTSPARPPGFGSPGGTPSE